VCFDAKALACLRAARELSEEALQGDPSAGLDVPRPMDARHGALAEELFDLVSARDDSAEERLLRARRQ
jgi:hypothetical protein